MGSSSHDLGAELRMHSFNVNCDTFSIEEKVAAVVPVTGVEVTYSQAMLALCFSTLMVKCLMIGSFFTCTSGRCNRQSEFTLLHFTIYH